MSGRERPTGGQSTPSKITKFKDILMRNTSTDTDDIRDPAQHGYQRVQSTADIGTGTLSTSTTGTSLDLMMVDDTIPLSGGGGNMSSLRQQQQQHPHHQQQSVPSNPNRPIIDPIFESDDFGTQPPEFIQTQQQLQKQQQQQQKQQFTGTAIMDPKKQQQQQKTSSKQSLKGSRVSFEKQAADNSSDDEDSFEKRRGLFQEQRTISGVDHKGILKDLKNMLANDDRKDFQSKKHVSLDIKGTYLKDLLKDSSSEEEFRKNRKDFQGRKHQSLDPRVNLKLIKGLGGNSSTSSDEDAADDKQSLIHPVHRYKDITKPIIVDLKDYESDDDNEDLISARKSFQQQRQISMDSKKSIRFFEMDEIGDKKSENLRRTIPLIRQITEDGKAKIEVYRPTTNPIYIWTQVVAALSVSLGSLVVGFSAAYTSPALVTMTNANLTSFVVTKDDASWVGGVMPLAGLAGGIIGGPLIEYLGRKNTILATAIPFILSWLLIACAVSIGMVLTGRALAGLCVGIASLSFPVYLGETLQPEVRGTLGLLPTAFGNVGILLAYVAGTFLNWSHLAYLGATLPIPFLILMFLIPETPRWYISRGREIRAKNALIWLRGQKADIEPELNSIIRSHTDSERHASTNAMKELLKINNLKPLMISLGLMFFQQLSGINAVIFYTVQIFQEAGSTIDGNICTIIVGIVNFAATFIATLLIDRLGRKVLLYISDAAMIITLFTLGGFFYVKNNGMDVSHLGWLPLASFVIFVLGFSLGFGPIPWLMMGEILPGKIRGSAASVATAFNWSCTFLVTKTFQNLLNTFGSHGAFWIFGSITIIGLFFVIFYVPETQGKSLEEIERKMMGRVRRMSSVANMKPLAFNM